MEFCKCLSSIAITGCYRGTFVAARHPSDYLFRTQFQIETKLLDIEKNVGHLEQEYHKTNDEIGRKRLRNEIIGKMRYPIDEFWRTYRIRLYAQTAYVKSGFDSTTTILSTASSIATASSSKTILSALSASLGHIGTSLDKNVLQQQAITLLMNQMDVDVKLYSEKINLGLIQTDDNYPLELAYADLMAYSNAMSIPSAIMSISANSGGQFKAVQNKILADIKGAGKNQGSTVTSSKDID